MPTITVEFEVSNVNEAQKVMNQNADVFERLTREAQEHGAKHHAFYTNGQTLIAIDEWDSEAGFHDFFDSNQEVRSIMDQAGVLKQPKVTILTPTEVPGAF